jgi:hypothetical protein
MSEGQEAGEREAIGEVEAKVFTPAQKRAWFSL